MTILSTSNGTTKNAPHHLMLPRATRHFQGMLENLTDELPTTERARIVGLTSRGRRHGVSTLAVHLALVAAQSETAKVLLLDANYRHPALYRLVTVGGLAPALKNDAPVRELAQPSGYERVSILAGNARPDWSTIRCASPTAWRRLLDEARQEYTWVFVDLPRALDRVTLRVSRELDAVFLLVLADRTRARHVHRISRRYWATGINLQGAIFREQGC